MYQRNGTFWLRVATVSGAARRVSLETKDAGTARKVAAWVRDVRDRLDRQGVLEAVIAGDITIAQAFVLGEADAAAYLAEQTAVLADVPVTDAMLDAWAAWLVSAKKRDGRTVAGYLTNVKLVWPTPRLVSWLVPQTILNALDSLAVQEQTKGRYKGSLSSLCQYLIRKGVLASNPVIHVPSYAQSVARSVHYGDVDALKVLHALPAQQRSMEAVMWACGWEWAAVANATVGDFDLDAMTARARGTKNSYRDRLTVITEPVIVPWVREQMKGKLPTAKMWPSLPHRHMIRRHHAACVAVGVTDSTLHDWRHTYAVKQLERGWTAKLVSQMLGHADESLVHRVYGKRVVSDDAVKAAAFQIKESTKATQRSETKAVQQFHIG